MNKQTHSEETLKRTKGIIGDEDKLKSSTENPKKELWEEYNIYDILCLIRDLNKQLKYHNDALKMLSKRIETIEQFLLNRENLAH